MAGERLKIPGYTEVSAVTISIHSTPDTGYAAAPNQYGHNGIQGRGETAILHVVRQTIQRAIDL